MIKPMIRTRRVAPRIQPGVTAGLASLLLDLGACGAPDTGDAPAGQSFTLRDSAGVEIVENHRPSWPEADGWRVDSMPLLRIGSQQGGAAYEFAGIAGAVTLPDDGVAVADEGSGQVRFFDATGEIVTIVGSKGQGPGEFTALSALDVAPDGRLWAYDFPLRRIFRIDPTDGTIESTTLGPEPPVLTAAGPLSDGAFALRQLWGAAAIAGATRAGVRRDSALVVVFDSAGALNDTVGAFPGREVVVSVENGRGVMTTRPFGADLVAVTRDTLVILGEQAQPRLDEYSAGGALRRRIVLPDRGDRVLDDSDIQGFVATKLVDVPEEERPAVRSDVSSLPFPERKPAYGRLLVDAAGDLWIGEWTRDGQTARRWSVVDERGVWLGDMMLPEGFRLLSVRSDRLVGVEKDELDTEYVVVYPLHKP